jgi:cbb3-type cytochrome oxidase subunit 1
MVIMKELYSQRLGNITYGLMNIGIIGFFLGLITTMYSLITMLFAMIILIAGITFAYNMFKTATRKELKMALPIDAFEAKFFEAAIIYFIIACAIGVLMVIKPDLIFKTFRAHAHLVLLGWVSITILGGMYHLVPMLVWTEIFSKKGKEPLPSSFKDLYSQKLGNASFWLMNIGVVGIFLSLIAARGLTIIFGIVVVLAALIFAYDMFKTMAKA